MISKVYWINETKIGHKRLGIMPRPRGNNWLDDEIKWLKIREVNFLVSLLEETEIQELELEEEKDLCKKWGIQFINFPIEDVNTPKNEDSFLSLSKNLTKEIQNNKNIVIHCRMGIGRSSTLAGAIMLNLGFEAKEIFSIIGKHRGLEVPDTQEQKDWLFKIEEKL